MAAGDVPIIGGFLGPSSTETAGKQKMAGMADAAEDYAAYRKYAHQQRMNALGNLTALFSPVNNAMGQMYGQSAQFDMGALNKDPVPQQNLWPSYPVPQGPANPVNKHKLQMNQAVMDQLHPFNLSGSSDVDTRKPWEMPSTGPNDFANKKGMATIDAFQKADPWDVVKNPGKYARAGDNVQKTGRR